MQELKLELSGIELDLITSAQKLRHIFKALLYVPDNRIKPYILDEVMRYYTPKLADPTYKIRCIVAQQHDLPIGFVICQIHPHYTSYGRKCCVFSWLIADNFEVCQILMDACEQFAQEHKMRRLRGPINFPKIIGGMGIQTSGFQEQMLSGIAFRKEDSEILSYLEQLGYGWESEYTCLRVEAQTWDKGKKVDNDIALKFWTVDEVESLREPVLDLVQRSFHGIVPDSSGLDEKFEELLYTIISLPKFYYEIEEPFIAEKWTNIPEFIDSYKEKDMRKVISFWPTAYDKHTNKMVGILATHPDLFEIYLNGTATRINVDTVMVDKDYSGRGIFSAMNNIGQIACNVHGIQYFEGTHIWTKNSKGVNNQRAIDTIFPHCHPIRTYLVFEKKIKRN